MLPQNFFIFILFYDFYRKAYSNRSEVTESGVEKELNNIVATANDSKYSDYLKKKKMGQNLHEQTSVFNHKTEWGERMPPIVLSSRCPLFATDKNFHTFGP